MSQESMVRLTIGVILCIPAMAIFLPVLFALIFRFSKRREEAALPVAREKDIETVSDLLRALHEDVSLDEIIERCSDGLRDDIARDRLWKALLTAKKEATTETTPRGRCIQPDVAPFTGFSGAAGTSGVTGGASSGFGGAGIVAQRAIMKCIALDCPLCTKQGISAGPTGDAKVQS